LELVPYGAGTIPFNTAEEACAYVERYFFDFPFVPQELEAEAVALWGDRSFPRIKTQDWGPISGEVQDLEKYCSRLERAARLIAPLAPERWLVLDEPVFQSIGTPFFPGNPDTAVEAVNAVINSTDIGGARWGLHVCGNTDFSLISRLDIELFHFDAWMAWDALKLYRGDLEAFTSSGGVVAPGLVPVAHEVGEAERARAIAEDALEVLGSTSQVLLPLGPACGMKAVTEGRAHEVGTLIRALVDGVSGG
jgi:hypothetical protein